MSHIRTESIVSNRLFPETGTYLGTVIEIPKPEAYTPSEDGIVDIDKAIQMNAAVYQWNQAKMATYAVRYGVITSDSTRMVEHRHPDDPSIIDVYADPPLGIKRHIPVLAQHIARDTTQQLDHLNVTPELRPIWLPLGRQALRRVQVVY